MLVLHGNTQPEFFMKIYQPDDREYRLAHSGTVFIRYDRGVVRGSGTDRLDLLHRLSTNAVGELQPGGETTTILTSDKGRIIDVVRVVAFDDHILMILLDSDAERVRAWLDKYTIMDDFATEDLSDRYVPVGLHGEGARGLLSRTLAIEPPNSGSAVSVSIGGADVVVLRDVRVSGIGSFLLIVPSDAVDELTQRLEGAGAVEIGPETFHTLRVEAGVPASGSELTDRYNPLEAGLVQYISFTKGCYIGQEVIARLDTYDKVQRHLVGLTLDRLPDASGESDALDLYGVDEEKSIGTVTSVAWSPGLGRPIALAYLRTQFAVPGLAVRIGTPEDALGQISGTVTKLPFDR